MSDEHKQYASTSAATLEAHILSAYSAKSEAEWWAQREIERLRAENEKLRDMLLRSDKLTRQEWYDMREAQLAEEANTALKETDNGTV